MGDRNIICFVCGGDGKETCTNPDHGFLGLIGNIVSGNESACPCCGHDPNHKIKNGNECECCDGTGLLSEGYFNKFSKEFSYDEEPIYFLKK